MPRASPTRASGGTDGHSDGDNHDKDRNKGEPKTFGAPAVIPMSYKKGNAKNKNRIKNQKFGSQGGPDQFKRGGGGSQRKRSPSAIKVAAAEAVAMPKTVKAVAGGGKVAAAAVAATRRPTSARRSRIPSGQ